MKTHFESIALFPKLVQGVKPSNLFRTRLINKAMIGIVFCVILAGCGAISAVQTGGLIASGKTTTFTLQQTVKFDDTPKHVDVKALIIATGTGLGMKVTAESDHSMNFELDNVSGVESYFLNKNLSITISTYHGAAYDQKGLIEGKMMLSITGGVVGNYKEGTKENLKTFMDKFEQSFLEKLNTQTASN